jgi:hypothetical protein
MVDAFDHGRGDSQRDVATLSFSLSGTDGEDAGLVPKYSLDRIAAQLPHLRHLGG